MALFKQRKCGIVVKILYNVSISEGRHQMTSFRCFFPPSEVGGKGHCSASPSQSEQLAISIRMNEFTQYRSSNTIHMNNKLLTLNIRSQL